MSDAFADGMAASLEEFSPELAAGVMDELRKGWQAETVLAQTRQAKIAEASDRIEYAAIEGIGEITMRLDPTLYHYWGQRLGYDCWKDKAFKAEILRDNESARIRRRRQVNPTFAIPQNSTYSPRQTANSAPANSRNGTATAPGMARTTPSQKPAAGVATSSSPLPTKPAGKIII